MNKKISKKETVEKISQFFLGIKNKTPNEIKKIKQLAMGVNFPLKEKRKLFCSGCLNPYIGREKIKIKNKIKSIGCLECGKISRWKIK